MVDKIVEDQSSRLIKICRRCDYNSVCGNVNSPFYHTKLDFIGDVLFGTNNCVYKKNMEMEEERRTLREIEILKEKLLRDKLVEDCPAYSPHPL